MKSSAHLLPFWERKILDETPRQWHGFFHRQRQRSPVPLYPAGQQTGLPVNDAITQTAAGIREKSDFNQAGFIFKRQKLYGFTAARAAQPCR